MAAFFFGATRFVLRFFPFLFLRLSLNKTSALVAVIPVIFYTFIAGLGVAAVRSTIMVLFFLLALLLDREKDLYDAWSNNCPPALISCAILFRENCITKLILVI